MGQAPPGEPADQEAADVAPRPQPRDTQFEAVEAVENTSPQVEEMGSRGGPDSARAVAALEAATAAGYDMRDGEGFDSGVLFTLLEVDGVPLEGVQWDVTSPGGDYVGQGWADADGLHVHRLLAPATYVIELPHVPDGYRLADSNSDPVVVRMDPGVNYFIPFDLVRDTGS